MKKTLFALSLISMLWACQKDERTEDSELTNKPKGPHGKTLEAGDGEWDLLGFGYNLTGEYAISDASTFQIIDVERLKNEHPTYINNSGSETSSPYFIVGMNSEDFTRKITAKTKLTGGDKLLFKGTIDANFSQEDKWSSKYIYASYTNLIVKRRVRLIADTELLKNYLHQGFIDHVNAYTPEQLVSTYGTHVLTDIRLGGKMDLIYRAETTNSDRIIAAGAGVETSFFKIFNQNTSGTYDATAKLKNFNEQVMARTVGGASQSTVKGITFNQDGIPTATIDVSTWGAGVTDANAELVEISENGAIPLYDLISDPTKKAAVKEYVDQYLIDNQVRLSYETDPNANVYSTIDGMGDHAEGAGVALADINGNQIPDAFFMAHDAPNGPNQFRYKVAFDMSYGVSSSISETKYVAGMGDYCEGAGITIADIDKNGVNDLILMAYDAPSGPNQFRYKIGYNLDANGNPAFWSSVKYISGIADISRGAGISFGDIDKNGTLDIILMAYDYPSGSNQIRYKVGYNVNTNGDAGSWSTTKYVPGMADIINGCAISLNDVDNNGTLDLVVFVEDNPSGENQYRYKIGFNMNSSGIAAYWSGVIGHKGAGHFSEGAGFAFGNLDGNPSKELILMSLDAPNGPNEIRYKVGFNLNSTGQTSIWR